MIKEEVYAEIRLSKTIHTPFAERRKGTIDSYIFASDAFGAILMTILILATLFEFRQKSRKKHVFLLLCLNTLLMLIADGITYLPNTVIHSHGLVFLLTLFTVIAPFLSLILFSFYMHLHISQKAAVSKYPFLFSGAFMIVALIGTVIAVSHGKVFSIDEANQYVIEDGFEVYLTGYLLIILYFVVISIFSCRKLGLHDTVAALLFTLIPTVAIVQNVFIPELSLAIPSISLTMLIIFIMLQSERERSLLNREQLALIRAQSDELTGLKNRAGFAQMLGQAGSSAVGIIFCDLNSLKYTNDHYGHKAGDTMILRFSGMLLHTFDPNSVYRISGDEFIVMTYDETRDDFFEKARAFEEKLNEDEVPLASIGYTFGARTAIQMLIGTAESNMYLKKREFYQKHPDRIR